MQTRHSTTLTSAHEATNLAQVPSDWDERMKAIRADSEFMIFQCELRKLTIQELLENMSKTNGMSSEHQDLQTRWREYEQYLRAFARTVQGLSYTCPASSGNMRDLEELATVQCKLSDLCFTHLQSCIQGLSASIKQQQSSNDLQASYEAACDALGLVSEEEAHDEKAWSVVPLVDSDSGESDLASASESSASECETSKAEGEEVPHRRRSVHLADGLTA